MNIHSLGDGLHLLQRRAFQATLQAADIGSARYVREIFLAEVPCFPGDSERIAKCFLNIHGAPIKETPSSQSEYYRTTIYSVHFEGGLIVYGDALAREGAALVSQEIDYFDKRMALDVIEDALTTLSTPEDRGLVRGLCGAFYMCGLLSHVEWEELLARIPGGAGAGPD